MSSLESDKPKPRSPAVYKCGYLAVSSKGLGWKSWKRRWFLLTRTSLVFFKSEPKGNIDGSLALGGIELNSAGSVQPKADKKQLTLTFPDGRAFTLRAEDSEDYEEWREALEQALNAAPSPALVGHESIFRKDLLESLTETAVGDFPGTSRRPIKSLIVGRPILLALEDIDGSPSFLEKAIRFVEQYGVKVEGILRESADVTEVDKRVQDYENGKTEFAPDENAHVVGDCLKHVLREMPSAPVPAPCCTALLQALSLEDEAAKLDAVKMATEEIFPEPNRRLVQRILQMMRCVVQFEHLNRMNTAAVAACMAPLILRPLLAGECGPTAQLPPAPAPGGAGGGDDVADEAAQIRAATESATLAKAIVMFFSDHYDDIFPQGAPRTLLRTSSFVPFKSSSFWLADSADVDDDVDTVHFDDDDDDDDDEVAGGAGEEEDEAVAVPPGGSNRAATPARGPPGGVLGLARKQSGELRALGEKRKKEEGGGEKKKTMESFGSFSFRDLEEGSSPVQPASARSASRRTTPASSVRSANSSGRGKSGDGSAQFGSPSNDQQSATRDESGRGTPAGNLKSSLALGSVTPNHGSFSTGTPRSIRSELQSEAMEKRAAMGDEEAQIRVVELARQDLRTSISREARANAALRDSLLSRKSQLLEKRLSLQREVAMLREQVENQKQMFADMERSSGGPTPYLDPQLHRELSDIGGMEKDVTRLSSELTHLQRQLAHMQQSHQSPIAVQSAPTEARRMKVQKLLNLKVLLHQELERTMALCLEEQQKNAELEDKRKREDPSSLEVSVARQRASLAEAQASLQSELQRSKVLRKKMQLAQFSKIEGSGGSGGSDDFQHSASSDSLAELSVQLQHFRDRRSQLMHQLTQLSVEPQSPKKLSRAPSAMGPV